jgi:mannose/cellobiose epimerase-like protein (N-acyl-D-glucosamine 2-epimerase family)
VAEPRGASRVADALRLKVWDAYALRHGTRTRSGLPAGAEAADPRRYASFLRDHLLTNVVPFWARHAVDREHGGFLQDLGPEGVVGSDTTKYAAIQGRIVWSFAVAYRVDPRPEWLAIASDGARFLHDHMWDPTHGGWFRSVRREGEPIERIKRTVDQAFIALGLVEHYRVSGDQTSWERAATTLKLLDRHAWDRRHEGYREVCEEDWAVLSDLKTACIHDDMLTLMLSVTEVMPAPEYDYRMARLAHVVGERLMLGRPRRMVEKCRVDWTYSPSATMDAMDIGHSLKAAWALVEVHDRDGHEDRLEAARALVDFSLDHAWDRDHGGFYHALYRGGRLASRHKLWWTQCEGIVALAALWSRTGDPRYGAALDRLLKFSQAHFIDGERGEWFTAVEPDGALRDPRKGHRWKGPYHPVRVGFYGAKYLE